MRYGLRYRNEPERLPKRKRNLFKAFSGIYRGDSKDYIREILKGNRRSCRGKASARTDTTGYSRYDRNSDLECGTSGKREKDSDINYIAEICFSIGKAYRSKGMRRNRRVNVAVRETVCFPFKENIIDDSMNKDKGEKDSKKIENMVSRSNLSFDGAGNTETGNLSR